MTDSRIAVVTGANQGLGRALVEGLAARMAHQDRVLLTSRNRGRVEAAVADIADRFAQAAERLDAVDMLVADWRQAVHDGRAESEGYGTWLNIPSKVALVAAVRAVARERRSADLAQGKLLMALCPGLIDTDASRPWFDDMSRAQTPAQAASWPVELALAPTFDPAFYGELVQFGNVLPWESGIPVPHKATA